MSFQGSIQELPVPDIIQLVSVSGKTGMFTLVRGSERGFIHLKNGQMVHAPYTGKDVEVVSLDATNYGSRLIGARRMAGA